MSGFLPKPVELDALLFDKDGTLFDFHAMWGGWAYGVMQELAGGDESRLSALVEVTRYDALARQFLPDSMMISASNRECAATIQRAVPDRSLDEIEALMNARAAHAPLVPAVPLSPFLEGLRGAGLRLGVMTNDAEVSAHAHLRGAGVFELFDFVAGYDSGHGAKPAPDPLLAFARTVDARPEAVAMVGDSTHDLQAGRAAGMVTVGVLTGLAGADELAPFADVIFPDIGHIPAWLAG